jgi:uncharacterized membrane protein YphA (DoxX/SURF4 family)
MDRLIPLGRLFFATGLAAFGVLAIVTGDFVAGRAPPWPEALPGRLAWAYGTGVVLIGAGVAIVAGRGARVAALTAGTLIFGWALLRHLPVVATDTILGARWTNAGKALVFFGGAFAVAGSFPAQRASGALGRIINARAAFFDLGRVTLGAFLVLCGIQHFMFADFVASLVPTWIPGAYFWTYFAGVALISGGVGLFVRRTAPWAAALSGLMVFSWVWLVHVPRISSHGEWIAPFEALAVAGLALLLCRALPHKKTSSTRGGAL